MMKRMIGNTITIAGMTIEIISDAGDAWECRNLTTGEAVVMKKAVVENAIRLGQAEVVPSRDGRSV